MAQVHSTRLFPPAFWQLLCPKDRSALQTSLALLATLLLWTFFFAHVVLPLYSHPPAQLPSAPILRATLQEGGVAQSTAAAVTGSASGSDDTSAYAIVPKVDAEAMQLRARNEAALRERTLADMPACARAGRARSFLMVFMGHSGSTALITSLEQHSETYVFGREPVDHGKFVEGSSKEAALRAAAHTMEYFTNGTKEGKLAGFKIRPRHLLAQPAKFSELIDLFGTRIIWSYRSNILKQALGDYVIHYLGDKSPYEGLKVDANGTLQDSSKALVESFRIHDMDAMHKLLKSRVSGDKLVASALQKIRPDGCVLPVSYESYLKRPELTVERVQTFLGLNTSEMHPALRAKSTQDSMCDLVENWEDLCEAFFGCAAWRWMLDDFENGCSCSSLNPSLFQKSSKYCSTVESVGARLWGA